MQTPRTKELSPDSHGKCQPPARSPCFSMRAPRVSCSIFPAAPRTSGCGRYHLGRQLLKQGPALGWEQGALSCSRKAEVSGEEVRLIPHSVTSPAPNRLIAGPVIGRKDCPGLYTCVCNYFSNWGDKWHDWFPSAASAPRRRRPFSEAVVSAAVTQDGPWQTPSPVAER